MVSTEVKNRYQRLATSSSGHDLVVGVGDVLGGGEQVGHGDGETSDVVLSIEMVSLPVGGMMIRMAWGSTMRRRVWNLRHAERLGGLGLALVDRDDAGPDDLGHVGALVEAEAQGAGHERRHQHVGIDGDEGRPEGDAEGRGAGRGS